MAAGAVALLATASCQVNRIDSGSATVASVTVEPASATLPVGSTLTLIAIARDTQGKSIAGVSFEWSSDNETVATVDANGVVTGVSAGEVHVSATRNGIVGVVGVTVTPMPSGDLPAITVSPTTTYQVMRGWEATTQAGEECATTSFPLYQNQLMDRAVTELGIDRVRLELRSGEENSTNWDSLETVGAITYAEWRTHWYEVVNDNADPNVINPAGFHWNYVDDEVTQVVEPLRQRLQARGEQLYVNLNYVDFRHTGFEHRTAPAEYAEFIFATFNHLQQTYGWVPDAVEMVLEPDNTEWTPAQIGAAMVATGDRLAAAGWHPDFIAPSNASMSSAVTYFDGLMQVPRADEYLTELSYHRYSGVSTGALQNIATRAVQHGIQSAMLEWIGASYETLLQDLMVGRVSAWQQFALAYCGQSGTGNGGSYYVINVTNPSAPAIILGDRSRYLAQYFRYVRMNAVRVGATSSDNSLIPVAFRNADGKFVAVAKTGGATTFRIYGLPAGTYGVTYTTASSTAASGPDVVIGSGQPATVSVPAAGVVSIFGR